MAYIDTDFLIERFGERELLRLTDRSNSGAIVESVIDSSITDAESVIHSDVGNRYATPLVEAATTSAIKRACADITRYRLYDDKCPETVEKRNQEALLFLKDVSAGRATLGNVDPSGVSTTGEIVTARNAKDRLFSLANMEGY